MRVSCVLCICDMRYVICVKRACAGCIREVRWRTQRNFWVFGFETVTFWSAGLFIARVVDERLAQSLHLVDYLLNTIMITY